MINQRELYKCYIQVILNFVTIFMKAMWNTGAFRMPRCKECTQKLCTFWYGLHIFNLVTLAKTNDLSLNVECSMIHQHSQNPSSIPIHKLSPTSFYINASLYKQPTSFLYQLFTIIKNMIKFWSHCLFTLFRFSGEYNFLNQLTANYHI